MSEREQLVFDRGLPDALLCLGEEAFVTSRDVELVLRRLPDSCRNSAAVGLKGRSAVDNAGRRVAPYTWEIRRDWDEDKGEHVNFRARGRKIAFIKRSQWNPPWSADTFEGNIERFSDGWQAARANYGRSDKGDQSILSACGRRGKDQWLRVMGWRSST
jgi:bifunctional DNA-binding transcriptional regulator/antitoxin component of YhaV-PrlF toxin-antitoxin module